MIDFVPYLSFRQHTSFHSHFILCHQTGPIDFDAVRGYL